MSFCDPTLPFPTLVAEGGSGKARGTMPLLRTAFPALSLVALVACGAEAGDAGQELVGEPTPELANADADPHGDPVAEEPIALQPMPEDPSGPRDAEPVGAPTPEASPANPEPVSRCPEPPPVAVTPSDPAPSDPAPAPEPSAPEPVVVPEGVEFIPWEEFHAEAEDSAGTLSAPLDVRSVSWASGYEDEDFVLAVATDSGNNDVIAFDASERRLRKHWPHFDCGDCRVTAAAHGTVILTSTTLYGSSDGGYRYFDIASAAFGDPAANALYAYGDVVWLRDAEGWLQTSFNSNQALTRPSWSSRSIASVDADSGLEVSARSIARHSDAGDSSTTEVCATVPDISFGSAFHDGAFVVVLCDEDTVRVTYGFPDEPFQQFDVDGPVTRVSRTVVATEAGWYGVTPETLGLRVGDQAPLADGEAVFGHVETPGFGYRITSLGVGVSELVVAEGG